MEANELRIGNLVEYPSGATYKVDILYKEYSLLETWKAIPLTEEWLLKLGFNNNIFDFCFEIIDFYITNDESKFMFQSCLEIKTVHQLQNLYFAITETELIFKS